MFMDKIKELYVKYKEIINYLIIGVLTTIVSLLSYYICVVTFLDPLNPIQLQIANVISWILAVTFAYFTNRKYVFESKNKNIMGEMTGFFASRLATLFMDMAIMFFTVTVCGMNDKIAKLIVQVVVTVGNYLFSKLLVFKKEKNEKASEPESEVETENQ